MKIDFIREVIYLGLGDSLLAFFGITKRRAITLTAAVAVVSTSFGFLTRDIVNFAKIEGAKKPAALARAENKIFRDTLNKFNKAKLNEKRILSEDILKEIKELVEKIRKTILGAEKLRAEAYQMEDRGDTEGALENLEIISRGLGRAISLLPRSDMKVVIEGDKEVEVCPAEIIYLVGDSLRTLKEDVDADIVRLGSSLETNGHD